MEPQRLKDFLAWEPQLPAELIGKMTLVEGGSAILVGRYKTFKSMLAGNIALCMAEGKDVLGNLPTKPGGASTLYVQTEISHPLLHFRIKPMWDSLWTPPAINGSVPALNGGNAVPKQPTTGKEVWFWTEAFLKLDTDVGMVKLAEQVERLRPDLVIIDPLYKVLSGKMTDQEVITKLTDNLDLLRAKYNVAVLLITHTRKPKGDEGEPAYGDSDDMFGSSVFSWWPDTIIQVGRKANTSPDNIVVKMEVTRHAREEIPNVTLRFDRKTLLFTPAVLV